MNHTFGLFGNFLFLQSPSLVQTVYTRRWHTGSTPSMSTTQVLFAFHFWLEVKSSAMVQTINKLPAYLGGEETHLKNVAVTLKIVLSIFSHL